MRKTKRSVCHCQCHTKMQKCIPRCQSTASTPPPQIHTCSAPQEGWSFRLSQLGPKFPFINTRLFSGTSSSGCLIEDIWVLRQGEVVRYFPPYCSDHYYCTLPPLQVYRHCPTDLRDSDSFKAYITCAVFSGDGQEVKYHTAFFDSLSFIYTLIGARQLQ